MSQSKYDGIVVSSRVRLARNIGKFPFPCKLSGDEQTQKSILKTAQTAADKVFKYATFQISSLDEVNRLAMVERHLISTELAENRAGGAVLISSDNEISVMVNEEDHIRAQCILNGFALKEAYRKIARYDEALSSVCTVAYSEKYGYLTCCPSNVGTGMRASVMMFLPGLSLLGSMEQVIGELQKIGVTVRGVYGEGSNADGFMYQISNRFTLGVKEEEIIEMTQTVVFKLCEMEAAARKNLFERQKDTLIDAIMRSVGILKYAKIMTSEEFMKRISYIKLGLWKGVLDGITYEQIDSVINEALPANLCLQSGRVLDADERDSARAELLRKELKSLEGR